MIRTLVKKFHIFDDKESPETVIDSISKDAVFQGTNLWGLIFAIFIASLGLNINSTAVIIGAMLISPLMGPIMGIGLGLGINDLALVKNAVNNFLFAVAIGLITSTVYFLLTPLNDAYSELLARTSPTIYDVLIAVFGGLAGIVAVASKQKGNVIPGVAIATALMPPLCTAGYGLATLNMKYFFGAFYLFTINAVFIAIATLVTVRLLQFPVTHLRDKKADVHAHRIVMAIALLTLIPSIYFGYEMIKQNRFTHEANLFIKINSSIEGNYLLNQNIDFRGKKITLVYGGKEISPSTVKSMKEQLHAFGLHDTSLEVKQGISFLNEDRDSGRISRLTRTLEQKQQEVTSLKAAVDSVSAKHMLVRQVLREMKIQYPEISSASISQPQEYYDAVSDSIPLAFVKLTKPLPVSQRKRMEMWLKARLQCDKMNIIISR